MKVPIRPNLEQSIRVYFSHPPLWIAMMIRFTISLIYSIRYLNSNSSIDDGKASIFAGTGLGFGVRPDDRIHALMKKGEKNLTAAELKTLRTLAEAAETYEDKFQPLPVPKTLPDIVRYKLLQLHINQGFAARLFGISNAKFSLIMNGKQKPDIYFIKTVHDKLEVDANVLLKAI